MILDFNQHFKVPFRDYVLGDLEVNNLIGTDTFHAAQLATLRDPTFPCAVYYPEPGFVGNLGIVQRFNVVIRCYSAHSYDEAYEVYKAIVERLGGDSGPITISTDEGNIVIRPISTPSETYQANPRIFGVGSIYGVVLIG